MDGIKETLESLAQTFKTQMSAFENELLKRSGTPQQASIASLMAEFEVFRTFVLVTVQNLEKQVNILGSQNDNIEMRSRRGMLLLHGVPESRDEDPASVFCSVVTRHLDVRHLSPVDLSRVLRLGRPRVDKPRPMLIKFLSEALRDKVWYCKTNLKGTGITLSEFLTKPRHKIFLAAREKLGVSRCWTHEGRIMALDRDGKRQTITSIADISGLCSTITLESGSRGAGGETNVEAATTSAVAAAVSKTRRGVSAKRK
jgi:hypothetical protein